MADDQEKTEEPTDKKKEDARKKGQVPRSRELDTLLMTLFGAVIFLSLGPGMIQDFEQILHLGFSFNRQVAVDPSQILERIIMMLEHVFYILAPILATMLVIALTTPALMGGWIFATDNIGFKPEKINPIKGIGRMFSKNSLVELVKTLLKFTLVMSIAIFLLWSLAQEVLWISRDTPQNAMAHAGSILAWTFLSLTLGLFVLALLDVPFQLYQHNEQLKMSMQEIKDEYKETEGNPEIKGRIRRIQQEMAQKRMMQSVPQADVVVTNPTHYAVALKYDEQGSGAPKVVAMGVDLMAMQIRNIASANEVPVIQAPPLARALYYNAEIDQEIPQGLFKAVAQLLAYVLHMDNYMNQSAPDFSQLEIPDELKHDG